MIAGVCLGSGELLNQVRAMRTFLGDPAQGAGPFRLIPVLRARVTGVRGRETSLESYEDVRARGSLAREYTVTYRDALEANERIVAGEFWTGASAEPEVSVEKGINERFQIGLGDTIRVHTNRWQVGRKFQCEFNLAGLCLQTERLDCPHNEFSGIDLHAFQLQLTRFRQRKQS